MLLNKFKGALKLFVNGDDRWAFSNNVEVSYHATNFSKVVLHNVIHKTLLDDGLHFQNHPYLSQLDTLALATIYSDNEPIFTGIINSQGRYSLNPTTLKDKSIEIVDIRLWLSKKQPVDLVFEDTTPQRAVIELVKALDEKRIRVGRLDFSNNELINAYDTTSKSPYSVLKDIIATQSRSFLYFSQDRDGNLLINFKSEKTLREQNAIELSPKNWNEYDLIDINLEENVDDYFNKIRVESEQVFTTYASQEYFQVFSTMSSIWLKEPVGYLDISDAKSCYWYSLDKPQEHKPLSIISYEDYTKGRRCDLYWDKNEREVKFEKPKSWNNVVFCIVYHPLKRTAVTIENPEEIQRVHNLNSFKGDVFRYVKSDDFSSLKDLQQHAKNSLALNSKPRKELTIKTTRPFLELGDSVLLNFNDFKFDGRYVCYAFNAKLSSLISNSDITYRLRSGLNTDTLINFYDSQDYKQKPVIKDKKDIVYRYIDKTLGDGNIQYLTENPPRIRSNFSHSTHAEYRPNINIDT